MKEDIAMAKHVIWFLKTPNLTKRMINITCRDKSNTKAHSVSFFLHKKNKLWVLFCIGSADFQNCGPNKLKEAYLRVGGSRSCYPSTPLFGAQRTGTESTFPPRLPHGAAGLSGQDDLAISCNALQPPQPQWNAKVITLPGQNKYDFTAFQ